MCRNVGLTKNLALFQLEQSIYGGLNGQEIDTRNEGIILYQIGSRDR